MTTNQIAIFGLGVMGRNLALNFRDHGFEVLGYDPDVAARHRFLADTAGQAYSDVINLLAALQKPRVICLLIPSGASVVQQVEQLIRALSPGDILIDAGNSLYRETEGLQGRTSTAGIQLVGMGVSGGERGARRGPAIMAGGDASALERIAPLFRRIAARAPNGNPCFIAVGPGGSGHFVKMIHNGIEYADMQLIAEAAFLLRNLTDLDPAKIAAVFLEWNRGELASYLMEATADVLLAIDSIDGTPLVDKIVDVAAQNGTGSGAVVAALELGVPAPSIAEAVFARSLSARRNERAGRKLVPPVSGHVKAEQLLPALHSALLGGRIAAYAQGFSIIAAASDRYGWNINLAALADSWTNGCIIRARLLQDIAHSFTVHAQLSNLLLAPAIATRIDHAAAGWRQTLKWAVSHSLPTPVTAAGLAWRDAFASNRLWTDLIQGQRDYFGAHGFEHIDRPGKQHHDWTPD